MHTRSNAGYTLIELLTTLSIAAIVLHIGSSGFASIAEKTAHRNAIYTITDLLQRARSQAVTTGYRSLVCSINADGKCTRDWDGSELVIATDRNGNRDLDEEDNITYRLNRKSTRAMISWRNRLGDASITFQPSGTIVSNGTVSLSDPSGKNFADIVINNGGRARIERF